MKKKKILIAALLSIIQIQSKKQLGFNVHGNMYIPLDDDALEFITGLQVSSISHLSDIVLCASGGIRFYDEDISAAASLAIPVFGNKMEMKARDWVRHISLSLHVAWELADFPNLMIGIQSNVALSGIGLGVIISQKIERYEIGGSIYFLKELEFFKEKKDKTTIIYRDRIEKQSNSNNFDKDNKKGYNPENDEDFNLSSPNTEMFNRSWEKLYWKEVKNMDRLPTNSEIRTWKFQSNDLVKFYKTLSSELTDILNQSKPDETMFKSPEEMFKKLVNHKTLLQKSLQEKLIQLGFEKEYNNLETNKNQKAVLSDVNLSLALKACGDVFYSEYDAWNRLLTPFIENNPKKIKKALEILIKAKSFEKKTINDFNIQPNFINFVKEKMLTSNFYINYYPISRKEVLYDYIKDRCNFKEKILNEYNENKPNLEEAYKNLQIKYPEEFKKVSLYNLDLKYNPNEYCLNYLNYIANNYKDENYEKIKEWILKNNSTSFKDAKRELGAIGAKTFYFIAGQYQQDMENILNHKIKGMPLQKTQIIKYENISDQLDGDLQKIILKNTSHTVTFTKLAVSKNEKRKFHLATLKGSLFYYADGILMNCQHKEDDLIIMHYDKEKSLDENTDDIYEIIQSINTNKCIVYSKKNIYEILKALSQKTTFSKNIDNNNHNHVNNGDYANYDEEENHDKENAKITMTMNGSSNQDIFNDDDNESLYPETEETDLSNIGLISEDFADYDDFNPKLDTTDPIYNMQAKKGEEREDIREEESPLVEEEIIKDNSNHEIAETVLAENMPAEKEEAQDIGEEESPLVEEEIIKDNSNHEIAETVLAENMPAEKEEVQDIGEEESPLVEEEIIKDNSNHEIAETVLAENMPAEKEEAQDIGEEESPLVEEEIIKDNSNHETAEEASTKKLAFNEEETIESFINNDQGLSEEEEEENLKENLVQDQLNDICNELELIDNQTEISEADDQQDELLKQNELNAKKTREEALKLTQQKRELQEQIDKAVNEDDKMLKTILSIIEQDAKIHEKNRDQISLKDLEEIKKSQNQYKALLTFIRRELESKEKNTNGLQSLQNKDVQLALVKYNNLLNNLDKMLSNNEKTLRYNNNADTSKALMAYQRMIKEIQKLTLSQTNTNNSNDPEVVKIYQVMNRYSNMLNALNSTLLQHQKSNMVIQAKKRIKTKNDINVANEKYYDLIECIIKLNASLEKQKVRTKTAESVESIEKTIKKYEKMLSEIDALILAKEKESTLYDEKNKKNKLEEYEKCAESYKKTIKSIRDLTTDNIIDNASNFLIPLKKESTDENTNKNIQVIQSELAKKEKCKNALIKRNLKELHKECEAMLNNDPSYIREIYKTLHLAKESEILNILKDLSITEKIMFQKFCKQENDKLILELKNLGKIIHDMNHKNQQYLRLSDQKTKKAYTLQQRIEKNDMFIQDCQFYNAHEFVKHIPNHNRNDIQRILELIYELETIEGISRRVKRKIIKESDKEKKINEEKAQNKKKAVRVAIVSKTQATENRGTGHDTNDGFAVMGTTKDAYNRTKEHEKAIKKGEYDKKKRATDAFSPKKTK